MGRTGTGRTFAAFLGAGHRAEPVCRGVFRPHRTQARVAPQGSCDVLELEGVHRVPPLLQPVRAGGDPESGGHVFHGHSLLYIHTVFSTRKSAMPATDETTPPPNYPQGSACLDLEVRTCMEGHRAFTQEPQHRRLHHLGTRALRKAQGRRSGPTRRAIVRPVGRVLQVSLPGPRAQLQRSPVLECPDDLAHTASAHPGPRRRLFHSPERGDASP